MTETEEMTKARITEENASKKKKKEEKKQRKEEAEKEIKRNRMSRISKVNDEDLNIFFISKSNYREYFIG